MGRRSKPSRRFVLRAALQLTVAEGVLLVAGLALLAVGAVFALNASRAAEMASDHGKCVAADVARINPGNSVTWGRTAEVTFMLDGQSFNGTLHYDSEDKLSSGTQLPICVASNDTATWVVDTNDWNGESNALWWRRQAGDAALILGLIALLVFGFRHPWSVVDGD